MKRRPSVETLSVSVTVRLPVKHYDALYQQAVAARCSMAEHLRRLLTRRPPNDSKALRPD
jgi:hypothetical protein